MKMFVNPSPGISLLSFPSVSAYMLRELTRPEVRDEILALSNGQYGIDFAKKPKEEEPQASFRKLNVS